MDREKELKAAEEAQQEKERLRQKELQKAKTKENLRQPAPELAAKLDDETAKIMAQLLNRGAVSWGDPVQSSDEEEEEEEELERKPQPTVDAETTIKSKKDKAKKEKIKKKTAKKKKKKDKKESKKANVQEFTGFGTSSKTSKVGGWMR